jgi:hypothetical protein
MLAGQHSERPQKWHLVNVAISALRQGLGAIT